MSHFTKVATKINHLPSLLRALDKLELPYEAGTGCDVRGYTSNIDAKVSVHFDHYDLGVVLGEDGNYELVADWWGLETTLGRTEREIVDEINREYSLARVSLACEEAGYVLEGEPVYENGEIQMVAARWS